VPDALWQRCLGRITFTGVSVSMWQHHNNGTGNSVDCTLGLSIIRTALLSAFEIAEVKNKRRYAFTAFEVLVE